MSARFAKIFVVAAFAAGLVLPANMQAMNLGALFGSPVDAELAAQVPQNKRGAISKAEYDLACANMDVELAKLKEELADKQDDLANQTTKMIKSQARGAELALDIAKMEAIIASNLGNAEDNNKVLKDLKNDRTKNAADTIEYKSKVDQGTLFVRDWTQRVAAKEKTVTQFKSRRTTDAAVAAPAPVAKPEPVTDPVIIINKEPGAAPAQPVATPESDLQN